MNHTLYTSPELAPRSLHLHDFPILPASSAPLSPPSEGGSNDLPLAGWRKTSTHDSLIMSSPHSRQSPPGTALHELNTQDPYLSAPSDPEESDFHASAIRLTPIAGSPNHSSSPNESRRPSIQTSGYVPSRPSAYLAPSDIELGNDQGVWSTEDTSSLSGGITAPSTNTAWTSLDASNWLNPEHSIPSPLSAAETLTVPGHQSATQGSLSSAQQPGLGISHTSCGPGGLTVSTDQAHRIDPAAVSPRGRSPIVTVSKVSRGDSPVANKRRPSRSNTHLSPGGPDELSSESEHEHECDDHHSVSSLSVARSSDGNWVPNPSTGHGGLDPTARGNEYVPSPNDLKGQREREQKNQDISLWTASVSATISEAGDAPPTPPPRHHGGGRLRARSTGDRPLQQEDYFNLQFGSDRSIPGPGAMLHESSEEELSEGSDEAGETDVESLTADVNDPSRNDRSTPEMCSSLEATDRNGNFRLHPWQDPPRDTAPRTERMQPQSSTAAMVAFEMRAKDLETASLTATIDANSILNFERLTLSDQAKTKTRRSSSLIKRHLQQASSRFNLKRQASDFSISSAKTASQQIGSEVPQWKESSSHRHRRSLSSRHNRSTSVTSLLMSMSGQMAAVGGSHSVRAVSHNPEASPALPVRNRDRSRSEVPRPVTPGLMELMTTHGGPPVAGIYRSPKQPTVKVEQTAESAVPQARPTAADDEDDLDMADDKGLVMDFPPVSRLPVPTFEGFQAQIMQLNPRLEPALIQRFAQAQLRRYKNLVELQQKHSMAVANGTCKSGNNCFALGGKESLLQQRKNPVDSEAGQTQFHITDFSQGCDQPSYVLGEGAIATAQFPPGVPLPPVSRLPARFECPLCFEAKTIQKPSDWSKHVHEDLQPFTCSFPECNEPKSFKRKADWVRHENERHRQLEWWTCSFHECSHTCYRKDNFVKHLEREHKMRVPKVKKTKGSAAAENSSDSYREQEFEHLWQTVDECRHETERTPRQEPCRFCGNICSSWRKLTSHLGKHMEQLAMPVLELARQSCTPPNPAHPAGITGRSAETYPPLAAQLHTQRNDASVPSSAHLVARPQYPTGNTSTPASHNLPYEIPTLNYPSISGGELSMEPESITDSLQPDDQFPEYMLQFGQGVLHAQAQTQPLHQNSVTYPPPSNAVLRPRTPQTDAAMPRNSYVLDSQFQAQGSLYPAQASYPGTYQPVAHNVPYTSGPYSSSYSSQM